jgi:hypothetical protein
MVGRMDDGRRFLLGGSHHSTTIKKILPDAQAQNKIDGQFY